MSSPLVPAALLLAGLLPVGAAAADELPDPPRYALPAGWAPARALDGDLAAAARRAVTAATRPSDPWAAREGWRILAGIGPGSAPDAVAALPGASWFGRALLVRALGSMEDPGLVPVLAEAARDPAWAVRESAAEGLGLSAGGVPPGVLPALLRDTSWRVRGAAVEAVRQRALRGASPREEAALDVSPLAADADPDVARAALLALADLRVPAHRPVLLAALKDLEKATAAQGTSAEDAEEESLRTALRLLRGVAAGAAGDAAVLDHLHALGGSPDHPLAGPAMQEWFRLVGDAALAEPGPLERLLGIYFWKGGADAGSLAAVEDALVEIGDPAVEPLMRWILLPERAKKDPIPFDSSRRALHLVLRLQPRSAPAHLARVMRDPGLTFILRLHATTLGRRTCAVPLGPVFREVYAAEGGEGGLAANLLRGIAASGGPDAAGILARALVPAGKGGPPAEVRAAAAESLHERPALVDPAAVARAVAAETDAEVLHHLLPVAAASLGEGAPRAVARFLGDRRVRVRRDAARALSLRPGRESTGFLLALLLLEDGDDDRLPRYGPAAPTAAQREELRAVRAANAGGVRGSAVSSLRTCAGDRAPSILRRLLESRDPEIRRAAADNLFGLGDAGAAPALEARIGREGDPGLREHLLTVLAALGGPEADAAFERLLDGKDEDLRSGALRALAGDGATARAPEGARRCAGRPGAPPDERGTAMLALGRSRAPGAAAFLASMLAAAPPGEERRTILQALGHTRDPAAVPAVVALLAALDAPGAAPEEEDTADLAVEILGELRSDAATGPLVDLLRKALPAAFSGAADRAAAAARQRTALCVQSLGRCGGPSALEALLDAAFDRGFSRAAEAATADPLLHRPVRREDERWRPGIPEDLRKAGYRLAEALARWKDADLAAALRRRLDLLSRDGSAAALSEEWLVWLGNALAEPPATAPNRPRWWSRIVLLRQAAANPPRMTESDGAAFDGLFLHESEVAAEFAAARRSLDAARACRRLHDPVRADREERLYAALGMVVDAAEALRATGDGAAAAEAFDRAFAAGKEDRVARLVVEVLGDLRKEPALALRFGELAVRAEGNWSSYWPNLRALGAARLGAGDAAGAAEAFAAAVREQDAGAREPGRATAWTRFFLAMALAVLGKPEEALAVIGETAPLNDVVLDWIEREPAFGALRADGRLDEVLAPARRKFDL